MAEIIEMPKMSDTMVEGVIVSWLKQVGDVVKAGDVLAEVETDKATMELESYFDGTILYIGIEAGKAAPVGGLIAIIGKAGESIDEIVQRYQNKAGSSAAASAPEPPPAPTAAPQAAPLLSTQPPIPAQVADDDRLKVSPLARAMAKERGIALTEIQGSGEGGRIVKRDIETFVPRPAAVSFSDNVSLPAVGSYGIGEGFEDHTLSQMRKTIARRLTESKNSAPHFYLTMAVDMDQAIHIRKELNQLSETKISFNDLVIKACALGLQKHPKVNASWGGDKIRLYQHIHIGVAVAIEDGLMVPVLRFANTKGLSRIAQETQELAAKARDKQLQPSDYQGNTFTISNLGMFGIEQFTAIINPPDACILAVGAIQQIPVVKNGELAVGNMMKMTLSCDHRVVDGAVGSAFLQTVKQYLENPMRLML